MPEPLLPHLHRHPESVHCAGVEVSEGVEASALDAEPVADSVQLALDDEGRVNRRTPTCFKHEPHRTAPFALTVKLREPIGETLGYSANSRRRCRFWSLCLTTPYRLPHSHETYVAFNVFPPQSCNLTRAHPRLCRQPKQRLVWLVGCFDDAPSLVLVEDPHGQHQAVEGVAGHIPPCARAVPDHAHGSDAIAYSLWGAGRCCDEGLKQRRLNVPQRI